jgi:hypothetical protein
MTAKKLSLIAAGISLLVVGLGRAAVGADLMLGSLLLLPGEVVRFFFTGVHGSRQGLLAECLLLIPSAWAWFVAIWLVIATVIKKRPIQLPETTRGK